MIYQKGGLSGEINNPYWIENSKLWEMHKIKEKNSGNFSIKAR